MTDEPKVAFPISIALIGAPGTSKQLVADEFQKLSEDYFTEQDVTFGVISNPGNALQDTLDTPMGVFGSFFEDVRAYYMQYEAEQEARLAGISYLSNGSVLQNLAHAGVSLENILTGLQTPQAAQRAQQVQVAMTYLTFAFLERFRYTFAFWIPFAGAGVVLPGAADDPERNYSQRVDMALRTIFVNFNLRIQALDQPTVEEKTQMMFDTVKRIMTNGPDLPPAEEESAEVPPEPEPTLSE